MDDTNNGVARIPYLAPPQGAFPPPPFEAGAIKSSALYHIKTYQELYGATPSLQIESQAADNIGKAFEHLLHGRLIMML